VNSIVHTRDSRQLPSHQVESERESPYVQTCHNQYNENARLLKIRRFGLIQKLRSPRSIARNTPAACGVFCKERINLVTQSPSCSRENRSDGRSRGRDPFD